ncbi:hypothetical protein [Sphingomonas nostoxanthinifaciens]|uniref:hypothetical protein n=1 Tax=Sphingomonas nostoxanthinifaciens TaxID=2872652 RepID=UPI001CC1C451|nr:hypothetical protein [Sphingomonas nostoxanthinifaciens]UAK25507.1 hypothetical protein K8P63_04905 [Sphingomonas nostoxanthinifaciens]
MNLLDALSMLSDAVCIGFAVWTFPSLWRVITGRRTQYSDPLKVLALLLISSHYSFTIVRWAFGAHRDLINHAEKIGREAAYVWSMLTIGGAVIVIRGYKAMGR